MFQDMFALYVGVLLEINPNLISKCAALVIVIVIMFHECILMHFV